MHKWQKERKEKLTDLALGTHVLAYLIIVTIFIIYEAKADFSFQIAFITLSLLIPAGIFIILDYYFWQRDSNKHTLLLWDFTKHTALFLAITFVFVKHEGKFLELVGVLYLLPVVLACITLGRKWGLAFAGVATGTILMLKWNYIIANQDQTLEIILAFGGVFFLLAWFLGGIVEVEKRTTNQLAQMANQDELTGLANHRFFQEKLEWSVKDALQLNQPLSLILLDIDYFKRYNDTYGHTQGDLLLQELGKLLEANLPPKACLARYGGEEFAIILPNMDPEHAGKIARGICESVLIHDFSGEISQPYQKITVSAGVAGMPAHAANKFDLIRAADEALYSSKFTGRNRVRTYLSVLERLSSSAGKNDQELINSLKTLMTVINAKDKYTYGHSERVAHYAKLVGRRLGMTEEDLRLLEYGAFLHDIGKLEVPREILNKSNSLTNEEWNIMKQHASFGAEILKPAQALQPVIPMVLHHHENYDGSGYPNGLKGKDIPLYSRILRVVDSYDAITTYRPYRTPVTPDEAIKDIVRSKGLHYDPKVVDAFVSVMQIYSRTNYFPEERKHISSQS